MIIGFLSVISYWNQAVTFLTAFVNTDKVVPVVKLTLFYNPKKVSRRHYTHVFLY